VRRVSRDGTRGRLALALGIVALSVVAPTSAQATTHVELIRTYHSDIRGVVFEVCRGRFDPPLTDLYNPAYCRGTPERWTQLRWQAYNAGVGVSGADGSRPKPKPEAPKSGPAVAVGAAPGGAAAAQSATPYGGSLDPTSVLGIENPLCGERGQLSAAQVGNCRASHSPEAAYPVGNYGWDIHIEQGGFITGLLSPVVSLVLQIFSVVWLLLLMILKGCLIVLGFTFSLSPFTDNHMLRQIGSGLNGFYENLTSPWLSTLMVIIGGWALYNGIVRRKAGETLGGMLAALVMMLAAMWVIHSPRDTVGRVAEITNQTALAAVAAPSSGHIDAPIRSYNDAMAGVWNQMTAVPFCAMDFSDVHWCMTAKPSQKALDAAKGGLNFGDAFTQQILAHLPADQDKATRVLSQRLAILFGPAPTIRDLYLRFSPTGGPRDALWAYYNGKPDEHLGLPLNIGPQLDLGGGTAGAAPEKVAMQGRSGLLTRMVLVLIFALGLIGGLLLLLWLAMKLVMATAASFVLVLVAPLAMFFPAFGASGRAAFVRWATSLLGAIVAKLIFSALLGIVLLGSSVLGSGVGGSSPTLGLIAAMAFWWAVFLGRERFLALLQIDPVRDRDLGAYRTMAGGYLGYRVAKAAKNAITRRRSEREERARHEDEQRARGQREAADTDLTEQAQQRLDVATGKAQVRDAAYSQAERDAKALREDPDLRTLHRDPSRLDEAGRQRAERKAVELRGLESEIEAGCPQARADRQLLTRVRANQAAGLPRHSRAEIEGAKESIRRESALSAEAPEHRWRAEAQGKDPASAEGREAIAESLAKSRAALGATSRERLEQVDLHRPQRIGGQRRLSGALRRSGPKGPPMNETPSERRTTSRPRRRSRARDGLSR
jgi:hypothetical protein